jgi:hypothetical protein
MVWDDPTRGLKCYICGSNRYRWLCFKLYILSNTHATTNSDRNTRFNTSINTRGHTNPD